MNEASVVTVIRAAITAADGDKVRAEQLARGAAVGLLYGLCGKDKGATLAQLRMHQALDLEAVRKL